MAKDWDYYKKKNLEDEIERTKHWHSIIEGMIESPIERIAFMHLIFMSNNIFGIYEVQVKPQFKVGPYIADFMVIHRDTDTWIVVECDGHDFHEKTKAQAAHDKKRDRYFTKNDYIVLRYTGSQICENPYELHDDVARIIYDRKKKHEALYGSGEGNGGRTT